jgi:hypothetical protein
LAAPKTQLSLEKVFFRVQQDLGSLSFEPYILCNAHAMNSESLMIGAFDHNHFFSLSTIYYIIAFLESQENHLQDI